MRDSREEIQSDEIKLMDILIDIRLTNVTEIKVIQEVVSFIDAKYSADKDKIQLADVAALILNRSDIPNLYATSSRGYNNQRIKFQNQYGVRVREELLPWAVKKITQEKLPQNLQQDLRMAVNNQNSPKQAEDTDIFDVFANINLANVTEFQVIEAAFNKIKQNYPEAVRQVNLSDACALALNHQEVSSLYATSAEEYHQLKQNYLSQHQAKVNQIVHQMVEKVYAEGSEHFMSQDSLVSISHQRRKKLTKSWNN